MLFTYPKDALACNWFNSCIITTLLAGMDAIDTGGSPIQWPDCLPEEKRQIVQRQRGLRSRLEAVWTAYKDLAENERSALRAAIAQQTSIPDLYGDTSLTCAGLSELPATLRPALQDLAEYAFGKLSTLREGGKPLRDIHFDRVQDAGIRVCPFCGLEPFQPAGLARNAVDHLMPISKYPFVSSDFQNLPPACNSCNSRFKKDQDILYDQDRNRRPCSDPYDGPVYKVCLTESKFEGGELIKGRRLPRWRIGLIGEPPSQRDTWATVYKISERYEAILNRDFIGWLEHFANWLVREDRTARGKAPQQIAEELPRYIENVLQGGFDDMSFLKAEAFKMLHDASNDTDVGNDAQKFLAAFVEYAT